MYRKVRMNFQQATELIDHMGFAHGDMMEVTFDGWVTGEPVRRYQQAFYGRGRGDWLATDGVAGPVTFKTLQEWGTRLSVDFQANEFADRGTGRNWVDRELVGGVQMLRERTGRPLHIISGCRGPVRNAAVGGAPRSQHLVGRAADISPAPPQKLVRGLRYFTGLGLAGKGSVVRHVDVREGATPDKPVVWRY